MLERFPFVQQKPGGINFTSTGGSPRISKPPPNAPAFRPGRFPEEEDLNPLEGFGNLQVYVKGRAFAPAYRDVNPLNLLQRK
ncbi:hypothetical protein KM043_009459 [Ampulex compressa]|nr:hypothetical protein KM043_009459 [Ampulex compressa]